MDQTQIEALPECLKYDVVMHILGKGRHTLHNLVKDGSLEKIGWKSSARITLASVLRYLEAQKEIAVVASMLPDASMARAREFAKLKRQEHLRAKLAGIVGGYAVDAKEAVDPGCLFEGVFMSCAERDEAMEKQKMRNRPRSHALVRGI